MVVTVGQSPNSDSLLCFLCVAHKSCPTVHSDSLPCSISSVPLSSLHLSCSSAGSSCCQVINCLRNATKWVCFMQTRHKLCSGETVKILISCQSDCVTDKMHTKTRADNGGTQQTDNAKTARGYLPKGAILIQLT